MSLLLLLLLLLLSSSEWFSCVHIHVQNAAAHFVMEMSCSDYVHDVLIQLHWLLVL